MFHAPGSDVFCAPGSNMFHAPTGIGGRSGVVLGADWDRRPSGRRSATGVVAASFQAPALQSDHTAKNTGRLKDAGPSGRLKDAPPDAPPLSEASGKIAVLREKPPRAYSLS